MLTKQTAGTKPIHVKLAPWQAVSLFSPLDHLAMFGGIACVSASTRIETIDGPCRIDRLKEGTLVWSLGDQGPRLIKCGRPFVKGKAHLYRVVHEAGEFVAHERHLMLCADGNYRPVHSLHVGDGLSSFEIAPPESNSEAGPLSFPSDGKPHSIGKTELFQNSSDCRPLNVSALRDRKFSSCVIGHTTILKIDRLSYEEEFWDVKIPGTGCYIAEGAVHHNTGKTFTGAHFCIYHLLNFPKLTGFIAANTYDQLSQATLRELFYWLDQYRIEYVIDRRPPAHWGTAREFRTYKNVLTIRHPRLGTMVYAICRVLSDPHALRGIEFSWYYLDETRDTPEHAHDVIIARMRESSYRKGLITSTTNGEDWAYTKFVAKNDGKMFGSLHVPTLESLRLKIIDEFYYRTLLRSYSPLMAEQELHARHVNVYGGRAYYAANERNRMRAAPWGDEYPNPERPLVVACDFNFAPAPHCWVIGQVGPELYGMRNQLWSEHIHWFGEIVISSSSEDASTPAMTTRVLSQYPGFHYRVFGDVSGGKGTTSNAGEHDYAQIADVMNEAGAFHEIDYDQSNPLVRDRVENANAMFLNALGERRMTYDPDRCPSLASDLRVVGWRKSLTATSKLDDGGDCNRTHTSDAVGYAVYKLFPPQWVTHGSIENVASPTLVGIDLNSAGR